MYLELLALAWPFVVLGLEPFEARGRLELVENEPGRCVFRFTDRDGAFRANVTDHLPPGVTLLLEKNGARRIESRVTLDELSADGLTVEVTTTYDA